MYWTRFVKSLLSLEFAVGTWRCVPVTERCKWKEEVACLQLRVYSIITFDQIVSFVHDSFGAVRVQNLSFVLCNLCLLSKILYAPDY